MISMMMVVASTKRQSQHNECELPGSRVWTCANIPCATDARGKVFRSVHTHVSYLNMSAFDFFPLPSSDHTVRYLLPLLNIIQSEFARSRTTVYENKFRIHRGCFFREKKMKLSLGFRKSSHGSCFHELYSRMIF